MDAHFGGAEAAKLRYQDSLASKPKRNIFQSMRERFAKGKQDFAPREIAETGKKYWWVLVILAVAGGAFAYFRSGRTFEPPAITLQGDTYLEIPLLGLGLAFLLLFSLLETTARHDPLLLDFLAAWGMVAILTFGQLYGHDFPIFWIALGAALFAMVLGTFFNPIQEGESRWWNRIDTTHWYVAGVALIFIHMMDSKSIPYPTFLPIIVPIVITIIGIGKEFFRETVFSLIAFAVGIVPAVTQSVTWIAVGFAVTFFLAAIAAKKGWVTTRGTTHSISIGGLDLEFVIAWDLVLFYLIEVVLIGFAVYQNYAVFTIG